MKTITMTEQDEFRFGAINSLIQKKTDIGQTMKMLDLSKRQVKRLRKECGNMGQKVSSIKVEAREATERHRMISEKRTEKLLKEKYRFRSEVRVPRNSANDHGIEHSKETVRVMMVGLGLRKVRHQKGNGSIGHGDLGKNITGRWSSSMGHTTNGSRKGRRALSPCLD